MGADDREVIVPAAPGRVEPYFDVTHLVTEETRQRRMDELRAEGYRQAITDLRDEVARTAHIGGWEVFDLAAEWLESRLSTEGSQSDGDATTS